MWHTRLKSPLLCNSDRLITWQRQLTSSTWHTSLTSDYVTHKAQITAVTATDPVHDQVRWHQVTTHKPDITAALWQRQTQYVTNSADSPFVPIPLVVSRGLYRRVPPPTWPRSLSRHSPSPVPATALHASQLVMGWLRRPTDPGLYSWLSSVVERPEPAPLPTGSPTSSLLHRQHL